MTKCDFFFQIWSPKCVWVIYFFPKMYTFIIVLMLQQSINYTISGLTLLITGHILCSHVLIPSLYIEICENNSDQFLNTLQMAQNNNQNKKFTWSVRNHWICWHVMMKRCGQVRTLFKFVVIEVELFGDFAPSMTIKVVVDSSLVGTGFDLWFHAWTSCDPHPLVFVIPPVSVVSVRIKKYMDIG